MNSHFKQPATQTNFRRPNLDNIPPKLNTPAKPTFQDSPRSSAPEPEKAVTKQSLEGKVIRSKKSKLEELNSHTINSKGEVVSFIQAFFPK